MSDPRSAPGFASAIAPPIAEALAKHKSQPPDKQNQNRAYIGAFLLGVCGYTAVTLNPVDYTSEWKLVFLAVCAWGLLLLILGWRGSRGRRNPLGAILALAVPSAGFFAVMNYAPALLDSLAVRTFCCGIVTANLVRFWIDIRGPGGGSAEKQVRQQITQNEIVWRGVKRR